MTSSKNVNIFEGLFPEEEKVEEVGEDQEAEEFDESEEGEETEEVDGIKGKDFISVPALSR